MSDPKLSRTLTEALKSPIGSTKRDQARSVFSIMKKLNGNVNNGQGGLYSSTPSTVNPQASMYNYNPQTDYSNMVIFQPAPEFKKSQTPVKTSSNSGIQYDSQGKSQSQNQGMTQEEYNNIFKTQSQSKSTPEKLPYIQGAPAKVWDAWSNRIVPAIGKGAKDVELSLAAAAEYGWKNVNTLESNVRQGISDFIKGYDPNEKNRYQDYTKLGDTWGVEKIAGSNLANTVSQNGIVQQNREDLAGTVSGALNNQPALPVDSIKGGTGVVGEGDGGTGATYGAPSGTKTDPTAQGYVDRSTGPLTYAKDRADALFEGGLKAEIERNDAELKEKLGYTKYEDQLNNMEANKGALIPTITSYIRGRDKYLTAIDQMIENTEMSLMKQDMSNPAIAESYNNYLTYLYTLKGRQTQRYGNYLNSAVDEYNTEFDRLDSKFTSIKEEFNRLGKQDYEITINEYNNTLAAAADLYTSLEEAPIKRRELQVLDNQIALQNIEIIDAINTENNVTDKDYSKKRDSYYNDLTDDDGNFNFDNIGPGGLAQYIETIGVSGVSGSKTAFVDALQRAISSTTTNVRNGNNADVNTLLRLQGLVNDLDKVEGGSVYTDDINPVFGNQTELISKEIYNNISYVKEALAALVGKEGPLGRKATEDNKKEKEYLWRSNFSSKLGDKILTAFYKTIESSSSAGQKPKDVVNILLDGSDSQVAQDLAKAIVNVKN